MAVISFPLGFKIVASAGSANTGSPIDERQVFGSSTIRTNYDSSFFYEGLLSYTTGTPYHGSGVTSNAGFYYRNSANAWVGFNADTLDDKHANGTMDSSSSSETDPTTGTNIVNHINYLYTLTSALTSSRTWKSAVATFADLATTYPTPSTGWAAVVNADNIIYVYDGSAWIPTSSNAPALSSSVDGIVSHTWYTGLSDFITNTANYTNKNVFGYVAVQNGGSPSAGSPITASTQQDTFTINTIGGLTSTVSGNTITINGSGGGVTPIDSILKWDTSTSKYRVYNDKTEAGGVSSNGKLYGSITDPTSTDRLNYDGYFYATKIYSNGSELEPALSNPAGNGYILTSTTGGVRSWIPQGSVGVNLADNILEWDMANNYYRPYSTQTAGAFDTSTTNPSHTTRLNYDGSLWVTNLKMSIGGSDNVTIDPSSTTGILTMNSTSSTAVCISSYQSAITSIVGATGASSAMYAGVLGESLGTNSKGVWGDATQSGIGIYGSSTDGIALYGTSATGIGLVINQTTGNTSDLIQAGVSSTNVFTLSYDGITQGYAFYSGIGQTVRSLLSPGGLDVTDSNSGGSTASYGRESIGFGGPGGNFFTGWCVMIPGVIEGGSPATIYKFGTKNTLSVSGSKIAVFQNNTVEKLSIDKDGNVNIPTGSTYQINGVPLAGGSGGIGTVTSIATTSPITGGTITTTGTIGITQATTSTNGYLSSTDWNTFNNKQSTLNYSLDQLILSVQIFS